jgi:hypothetical protein
MKITKTMKVSFGGKTHFVEDAFDCENPCLETIFSKDSIELELSEYSEYEDDDTEEVIGYWSTTFTDLVKKYKRVTIEI